MPMPEVILEMIVSRSLFVFFIFILFSGSYYLLSSLQLYRRRGISFFFVLRLTAHPLNSGLCATAGRLDPRTKRYFCTRTYCLTHFFHRRRSFAAVVFGFFGRPRHAPERRGVIRGWLYTLVCVKTHCLGCVHARNPRPRRGRLAGAPRPRDKRHRRTKRVHCYLSWNPPTWSRPIFDYPSTEAAGGGGGGGGRVSRGTIGTAASAPRRGAASEREDDIDGARRKQKKSTAQLLLYFVAPKW